VPIDPVEEGPHPAGEDVDWQESAYLAWRDPRAGLGGNHRIGTEPNRATANLWCGVYADDGTRFRHNDEGFALEKLDHGLLAGPQRLFHDGTDLRFVLDADGCQADLVVEDEPGPAERVGASAFAGAATILANNFHVFCRVRGTVAMDGRAFEINGRGWRDHSWGVRKWDSFLASRSFGGAWGSDLEFRYGSMVGVNGTFFRHGALVRDGVPLEVRETRMLVTMDDDSLRCTAADVFYRTTEGDTTVRLEVRGGMIGATGRRFGWESVGDATVNGEPGGWAFLEVNNNPRNGSDPPVFALGDALTNGVVRTLS
jgi:hypothetical protein